MARAQPKETKAKPAARRTLVHPKDLKVGDTFSQAGSLEDFEGGIRGVFECLNIRRSGKEPTVMTIVMARRKRDGARMKVYLVPWAELRVTRSCQ